MSGCKEEEIIQIKELVWSAFSRMKRKYWNDTEDDTMDEYGDVHRSVLQNIMRKGVLTNIEVLRLLDEFSESQITHSDAEIKNIIALINTEVSIFEKKIIFVNNESTGNEELVYISMSDDEISRSQKYYCKSELEYFKWLLEEIIISDGKTISGICALNLVSKVQIKNMSKVQAQKLLDKWVVGYYFKTEPSGNYTLNTRAIHEFEPYFFKYYPSFIDMCNLCKKSVFSGKSCPLCGEIFHSHCLNKYVERVNKCPKCKQSFEDIKMSPLSQLSIDS